MFFSKVKILFQEYKKLSVIEGSKILFFFCFWLTKLFSLLQHQHPKIDSLIHRLVNLLPKPLFVIKNKSGLFLVQAFDDSTTICSDYFEKELRGWLNKTSCKDTFIDIGANRGLYSVIASLNYNFKSVYSFEPNPEVFTTLKKNIALNELESSTYIYNSAIGDAVASQTLAVDPMHKGGGKITEEPTNNDISLKINVVTLDSLLTTDQMKSVGFVKIDTEGYEKKVLRGMLKTLEIMPESSCIMIETDEIEDIKDFLNPYNFSLIESHNIDYLFIKIAN